MKGLRVLLSAFALTFLAIQATASTVVSEEQAAKIAERIKPAGELCMQGDPCAAAVASGGDSGARSGEAVVTAFCGACHNVGLLGAPKIGDTAAWTARAEAAGGLDGLLSVSKKGINAMPAMGNCADCSDDELRAAIQHMSGL
jgi:cytochrome c5